MKISIISNGYHYSEYIQKIETPASSEVVTSEPNKEADFSKTLKEIQETLAAREKELNPVKEEENEVAGSTTESGYVSIAPDNLAPIFKQAAETYGLDQKLLELIGQRESNFKADVTSSAGAMGIMQLMPGTASGLGVTNAYDPQQNIMGAAKLIKNLSDKYDGNLDLILAGYNAGTGAVSKYGGVPPYKETINYIAWIKERYL